jgi:hypothetical protein
MQLHNIVSKYYLLCFIHFIKCLQTAKFWRELNFWVVKVSLWTADCAGCCPDGGKGKQNKTRSGLRYRKHHRQVHGIALRNIVCLARLAPNLGPTRTSTITGPLPPGVTLLPWRWRQQVPLKRWWMSTNLCGLIFNKTIPVIGSVVEISVLKAPVVICSRKK